MNIDNLNRLAAQVVERDYHREHVEPDYVDEWLDFQLKSLSDDERATVEQLKANWTIGLDGEDATQVLASELLGRMNDSD